MNNNGKMKFAICCYSGMEVEAMRDACKENDVDSEVVDLLSHDWLKKIQRHEYDAFLIRPTCSYDEHKAIFDERVYFISHILKKNIYPNFDELYTYENKRNMATWLQYCNAPHPETTVITKKEDAINFIDKTTFPVVSKANLGSAGSAVKIIRNKKEATSLINSVFGRFHSEFALGNIPWGKRNNIPFPRVSRSQKHYLILQEYLDIKHEWRIIKIGESYFGHQKLIGGNGFASGSDLVGWVDPPKELFKLTDEIMNLLNSRSMAVDILETQSGQYYVNELQTIFGAYAPSQMYIENIPGRYILNESTSNYEFESGEYCNNACWNLRVEDLIKKLKALS